MTGARGVCLLALVAGVAAQYGAQGNSYDQELRRRQVEYAQQQAMRQQQAGYGNQQSQQAAYAQQQQQAAYQQQLRQQQAMKAQQQQQAQQRAYQEQLMQQQMREQAMRAQAQAGGSGQFQYGSSGGGSKPMTPKQKKELAKRQAAQKKAMEAKAKENKAAAAKRMKAWEQAQRKAHKGKGNMRAKRTSEKGGVVGFVFSIKGARRAKQECCAAPRQRGCLCRDLSTARWPLRSCATSVPLCAALCRRSDTVCACASFALLRRGAPRWHGLPVRGAAGGADEARAGAADGRQARARQELGPPAQARPTKDHPAQGLGRRRGRRAARRLVLSGGRTVSRWVWREAAKGAGGGDKEEPCCAVCRGFGGTLLSGLCVSN